MQAIVETLFDTVYLFSVITIGILMIRKSKGNRQFTMFGIMAVLLGSGDAFHLVPRAVALCTTGLENFTVQMGLGKWITSITMTILKSSPPQNLQQIVANFLYPFILQKYLFLTFFLQIFILQKSYHHLQYILYMFCIIISPIQFPFLTISIQASYKRAFAGPGTFQILSPVSDYQIRATIFPDDFLHNFCLWTESV